MAYGKRLVHNTNQNTHHKAKMQKNTLLGSTTGSAAGPSTGFTGGSGAGGSGAGGSGAGGNVGKSPAGYTRKKETTVYI